MLKHIGDEFAYLNEVVLKPIAEGKPFPRDEIKQITSRKAQKTFTQFLIGQLATIIAYNGNTSVDIIWVRDKVMDSDETFEDILEENTETGLPVMYKNHSIGRRRIKIWNSKIEVLGLSTGRKETGASTIKLGLKKGRSKYGILIFEERSQINNEKKAAVLEGIRGYEYLIIIEMSNPWLLYNDFISECHSIMPFDEKLLKNPPYRQWYDDGKTIIHYTNWRTNPFLKEWEKEKFLALEARDPIRAKVASYGLPGLASGAIYNDYLHEIIDLDLLPDDHFMKQPNEIFGGVDWGYVNDDMVAHLWGTDTNYSWMAGYDMISHNNKKSNTHKSNIQMVNDVVDFFIAMSKKWPLKKFGVKGLFIVLVDNANITIAELLNSRAIVMEADSWLHFTGSVKLPIKDRIDQTTAAMSLRKFALSRTRMKPLLQELESSQWTEITSRDQQPSRVDIEDHNLNTMEYAMVDVLYNIHNQHKEILMDQ